MNNSTPLRLSSSSEECFTDEASKTKLKSASSASESGRKRRKVRHAFELFSSVESFSAVNEENNKRNNTTSDTSEELFATPSTLNIADIPVIDSDTSLSDQPAKQQTEETSDEDEEVYLKRLQSNQSRIDPQTSAGNEEDEDEDEEPEGNEVCPVERTFSFSFSLSSGSRGVQRRAPRTNSRATTGTDATQLGRGFRSQTSILRSSAGLRRSTGPNEHQRHARHSRAEHHGSD